MRTLQIFVSVVVLSLGMFSNESFAGKSTNVNVNVNVVNNGYAAYQPVPTPYYGNGNVYQAPPAVYPVGGGCAHGCGGGGYYPQPYPYYPQQAYYPQYGYGYGYGYGARYGYGGGYRCGFYAGSTCQHRGCGGRKSFAFSAAFGGPNGGFRIGYASGPYGSAFSFGIGRFY